MAACKVCDVAVPPRREYQPSSCPGCQKFLKRYAPLRFSLECASGMNTCSISYVNRHKCKRCRVEKCIATGMRTGCLASSKLPRPTFKKVTSTKNARVMHNGNNLAQLSEHRTRNLAPLVRDPILFDGSAVETMSRTAAEAFTFLHGFENMSLRRTNSESSLSVENFANMMAQHLLQGSNITGSYAKFFSDALGINLNNLTQGYIIRQLGRLYLSLPNDGNSVLVGIDRRIAPFIQQEMPELLECIRLEADLKRSIADLNPPFIIAALLCGLLLFHNNEHNDPNVTEIQNRLLLAVGVNSLQLTNGNASAVEATILQCRQCIQKTQLCTPPTGLSCFTALANRLPAFLPVLSIIRRYSQPITASIAGK